MRNAMQDAGIAHYNLTKHAIDRARLRFGIVSDVASEWVNSIMEDAKPIGYAGVNQTIYESEDGSIRIIVDDRNNAVVTVHSTIRADFLRPTLERELRKLKRFYTRQTRKLELRYAEALQELSQMAINRAKARNPQTRELIAERIADKQAIIDGMLSEIERLKDEWQTKQRAIELIAE